MAKTELTLAQIYKLTYDIKFANLSPEMKERVLAVKSDTQLKDPEVDEWVREVCATSELTFDNQANDNSEDKPKPDLK